MREPKAERIDIKCNASTDNSAICCKHLSKVTQVYDFLVTIKTLNAPKFVPIDRALLFTVLAFLLSEVSIQLPDDQINTGQVLDIESIGYQNYWSRVVVVNHKIRD